MDKHLEWIVKKTQEAKDVEEIIPLLMEMDKAMKEMENNQLRDIVLYLVGRVNDKL